MIENIINVGDYLSVSKLPGTDFVINPYVGCPHACKYCYACFMKKFTNHREPWGKFIDIKFCQKPISLKCVAGKNIFISSVTDCYNQYEKKYEVTKKILEQLKFSDADITITTKSDLVLRDLEILKQFKKLSVAFSINTLDEGFKKDMDRASSIEARVLALKVLHEAGIYTVLFMSPMFPYLTDFKAIIEYTKDFVREYWFENLNLRVPYKSVIMRYIIEKHPELYSEYVKIYYKNDVSYWDKLAVEIDKYCAENMIKYENYFHHGSVLKN